MSERVRRGSTSPRAVGVLGLALATGLSGLAAAPAWGNELGVNTVQDQDGAGPAPGAIDPGAAPELRGGHGQVVALAAAPDERVAEGAGSQWWRWTAPVTGDVSFTTHGSDVGTVLTVHEGPVDALTPVVTNDDTGDVSTSSVVLPALEGETYLIEVEVEDQTSDEDDWLVLGWYAADADDGTGVPSPDVTSSAEPQAYPAIPLVGSTGEKPQSKVWKHDGRWWAVLPTTTVDPAGTYLWRLDAGGWTPELRVSTATAVHADALRVGDITHLMLHGPASELVTVQYVPGSGTYEIWRERTSPTPVSMPGSETATIDVDSTGRLWVAYDTPSAVVVRYSTSPFSSFSDPIVLASGITDDDIVAVASLPDGKVGVMWSDQNARRFGFRVRDDADAPSVWADDEQPGPSGGTGSGVADDHINLAVHSNGTLYAVVKTGYDTAGSPVIGLLVRRPSGTWDELRSVDTVGTRGIAVLNEDTDRLTVLYTSANGYNDILAKTAGLDDLGFAGAASVVVDGAYNNVTSSKANMTGDHLVMAASSSGTVHRTFVAPAAVTFQDQDGSASDTYTIPTKTGVEYLVGDVVQTAGVKSGSGTVTVTARAKAGYVLTDGAPSSWSHTFSTVSASVAVTPAAVTFKDQDGTASDTYTIPTKTGVEYLVGGVVQTAGVKPGSGTVTVTARAKAGYVLTDGAPSSWSHTFSTATALDPIERYITRVYLDLFDRPVDPAGMKTWSEALRTGTPRVAVANSITSSTEYRSKLIHGAYRTYLDRAPEAKGLADWLRFLEAGATVQQLEAGFLDSPEFYNRSGGTNRAWVAQLYRTVLKREAASWEVTYWAEQLSAGRTRTDVAMGFLLSTEHLTTVVNGYYMHLLGRHIDPSGQRTWVGILQAGGRVEAIIGGIISSPEYVNRT